MIVPTWRPELWKTWKDTSHQVSTQGRVKSVRKKNKSVYYNRLSKLKIGKRTYNVVRINGKIMKVHRLVMLTFFPHDNERWTSIDHIDGDGQNNDVSNLRWVTHRFNQTNRMSKPRLMWGKWNAHYEKSVGRKNKKFATKLEATIWLQVQKYKRMQLLRQEGHTFEPDLLQFYRQNLEQFCKPEWDFKTFFVRGKDGEKDRPQTLQIQKECGE